MRKTRHSCLRRYASLRVRILFWSTIVWTATGLPPSFAAEPSPASSNRDTPTAEKPNIVIILADDLGFSDLGCYGSEIETPNLDQLAQQGLRFTRFYNTGRCWPTRASLMTGYYPQQVRRDRVPGIRSGIQGKRPAWAHLLAELLKPHGYRTYHSGKWHIDSTPCASGFDHSYWVADHGRYFGPHEHYEDDRRLPPVKPTSGYYTTIAIADHAIRCLKEHQNKYESAPFFQYIAFTAPHFPLHALPEDIQRYRDRYHEGWNVIRQQRWRRIQELGIVDGTLSEVECLVGPNPQKQTLDLLGPGEVIRPLPWDELAPEQKRFQATKMAIYASMIYRMDHEIGRILDQLRQMDALNNTLLFFLSDNGASCEIIVRDDGHAPTAPPGSAASHLCLGLGWATSSNTPFRLHKKWVHQGGISTPLIVHWPEGISDHGQLRRNVGHVIDLVPTILDVAGGQQIDVPNDKPAPLLPGKSLVPVFTRDGSVDHDYLWWFHSGNRAVRIGNWKLVAAGSKGPWELFDINSDPTETNDLSAKHPEQVRELKEEWQQHLEEFRELAGQDLGAGN